MSSGVTWEEAFKAGVKAGAETERARIVAWLRERAKACLERAERRNKQGGPWGDSEADDAMAQHIALADCASLIEGGYHD